MMKPILFAVVAALCVSSTFAALPAICVGGASQFQPTLPTHARCNTAAAVDRAKCEAFSSDKCRPDWQGEKEKDGQQNQCHFWNKQNSAAVTEADLKQCCVDVGATWRETIPCSSFKGSYFPDSTTGITEWNTDTCAKTLHGQTFKAWMDFTTSLGCCADGTSNACAASSSSGTSSSSGNTCSSQGSTKITTYASDDCSGEPTKTSYFQVKTCSNIDGTNYKAACNGDKFQINIYASCDACVNGETPAQTMEETLPVNGCKKHAADKGGGSELTEGFSCDGNAAGQIKPTFYLFVSVVVALFFL